MTEGQEWLQISHHCASSLASCFCCGLTILLHQGNGFRVGKIAFLREGVKIVSMILLDFLCANICSRQNSVTMKMTLTLMTYDLSILHSQRSQQTPMTWPLCTSMDYVSSTQRALHSTVQIATKTSTTSSVVYFPRSSSGLMTIHQKIILTAHSGWSVASAATTKRELW